MDVERLRLCWPKPPFIQPNAAFRTAFTEEGPVGSCCVSLYAVDEEYYQKIQEWLKVGTFGGMAIIPERYRLDGVGFSVGGV